MSATSTPGKREGKSLTNITRQFIHILKNQPDRRMSVADVEQHLENLGIHFSRRRLSDVVNVLEGIGVIQRLQVQPRVYHVQLVANTSDPDFVSKKNRLNDEVRALSQKERELHDLLTQSLNAFKALKDHPSARTISASDLLQVDKLRNGLSFFIPSVDNMHLSVNLDMENFLADQGLNCVRARYTDPFTVQGFVLDDDFLGIPAASATAATTTATAAIPGAAAAAASRAAVTSNLPVLHTPSMPPSAQQDAGVPGAELEAELRGELGTAPETCVEAHGTRGPVGDTSGDDDDGDNGELAAKRSKRTGDRAGTTAASTQQPLWRGVMTPSSRRGPLFELKCKQDELPYTMVMSPSTTLSDLLGFD
ncbi:hypothetical protein PTSG_01693 [Salpingoeca rosetta]|uniref:E2F/DP family winged-helix DNA-binding domain-containing protein n=1 Tax=Salpingoeca rosetta (strain ATCC 50818 / BSB-021) TaxID=946362 RepID=F2TYN9_SALR5|nr:uncharacterized protein PTSG_01693 [Salpingoeca rosetta]EGD78713.1 hypothetical protein PTSG_01693 [Salpingoeca rosetta]|eukprot:XP_004997670.1 hypothetical protein PTSG_01693 [Salpingoeca rosetta]